MQVFFPCLLSIDGERVYEGQIIATTSPTGNKQPRNSMKINFQPRYNNAQSRKTPYLSPQNNATCQQQQAKSNGSRPTKYRR